ncbi:hypothetical protein EIP75_21640 [Aquabacterium soli]|uniref:SH3 domain-containing protein n=1 Tax=Aquabacterium soli TaxID=2493092 RepID=A0A3R8T8T7_9BURK|nr:hypothetical protein [Aquabacterium soli]RRS01181.1 hypothetical protein EIP75_21640 [Aquabacterium soli]
MNPTIRRAAITVALVVAIPGLARAQSYEATLSDSQVLLTDASPSRAQLTSCQPMKGERVSVLETKMNIDGMTGLNAARVLVLEGECKGARGWVGLARLEKASPKGG